MSVVTAAGETAAATRLGPVTGPGGARRARQALPAAAREKLERLETDADVARERARTLSDQARALHDEQQRLTRRLEELRATHPTLHPGQWVPDRSKGPTAKTWQPAIGDNLDDLARDLEEMTTELARLTRERDLAQERSNRLGQIAERSRRYLGV